MMISTGLPELKSEKELNYLKETLVSQSYLSCKIVFYVVKFIVHKYIFTNMIIDSL